MIRRCSRTERRYTLFSGVRLVQQSFYIDSEIMFQQPDYFRKVWIESGRFGLVLTDKLLGFRRLIPFMSGFMMACFMWMAGLMLSFCVCGGGMGRAFRGLYGLDIWILSGIHSLVCVSCADFVCNGLSVRSYEKSLPARDKTSGFVFGRMHRLCRFDNFDSAGIWKWGKFLCFRYGAMGNRRLRLHSEYQGCP